MDESETRFKVSTAFIEQAMELLPPSDYKKFLLNLIIKNDLGPNLFRAKMKFAFRNHQHLVYALNPLLPDEYQFSEEELRRKVGGSKGLEKYQPYITFVNNLKNKVSAETFHSFYALVKAHQQEEIHATELYGKAYELLRGDFDLMKRLSNILGNQLNGNPVDELIKACLHPCPSRDQCQDRIDELHVLRYKLKLAEEKVDKVFQKIKRGELNEESALREHLTSDKVRPKLRLAERMFINLEDLISKPLENFPVALDKLRLSNDRVARALLQYDTKHNHKHRSFLA